MTDENKLNLNIISSSVASALHRSVLRSFLASLARPLSRSLLHSSLHTLTSSVGARSQRFFCLSRVHLSIFSALFGPRLTLLSCQPILGLSLSPLFFTGSHFSQSAGMLFPSSLSFSPQLSSQFRASLFHFLFSSAALHSSSSLFSLAATFSRLALFFSFLVAAVDSHSQLFRRSFILSLAPLVLSFTSLLHRFSRARSSRSLLSRLPLLLGRSQLAPCSFCLRPFLFFYPPATGPAFLASFLWAPFFELTLLLRAASFSLCPLFSLSGIALCSSGTLALSLLGSGSAALFTRSLYRPGPSLRSFITAFTSLVGSSLTLFRAVSYQGFCRADDAVASLLASSFFRPSFLCQSSARISASFFVVRSRLRSLNRSLRLSLHSFCLGRDWLFFRAQLVLGSLSFISPKAAVWPLLPSFASRLFSRLFLSSLHYGSLRLSRCRAPFSILPFVRSAPPHSQLFPERPPLCSLPLLFRPRSFSSSLFARPLIHLGPQRS